MKLSDYAKTLGVSYKTAWRMWQRGELNAVNDHRKQLINRKTECLINCLEEKTNETCTETLN